MHHPPARQPSDAPVSARDVCVTLQGQEVLHDIDLHVGAGEFLGVLGPNGGGKTTLLRVLVGLQPASCGEVRVFGQPVTSREARRAVAYVPQNVVHVDSKFPATAHEVAMLARVGRRSLFARPNQEDTGLVREAMEEVGVWDLRDRQIGRLSGGQRQRVFLAKAIAQQPRMLLLDEPTTGVDEEARADFHGLLKHLHKDHGMAVVMVTHDPSPLSLLADRFVALDRSKRFDGPPSEFASLGGFSHIHAMECSHGKNRVAA
jgi:zinc transport system ATP-binding protein